jgi:hypothetical protein
MSNPAANTQIGTTGSARQWGIPLFAVQWTGNDGSTARVLQIFTDVTKTPGAVVQKGVDNVNEVQTLNRTQRTRQIKFSAAPIGANSAAAQAIAADLPLPMDIVSVGHMDSGAFTTATPLDSQIETTSAIVDDCSARWTPEGSLVVDFTCTIYLNADGTIRTYAALS